MFLSATIRSLVIKVKNSKDKNILPHFLGEVRRPNGKLAIKAKNMLGTKFN